mgnify:CR=1 FL=1
MWRKHIAKPNVPELISNAKVLAKTIEYNGHEITWDGLDGGGRGVATGTYFYRLEADGTSEAKKLTLLR